MGKDPAFLFYPGDWQGGTSTFSKHLKGCYMEVLIAQFNNGHLSLDEIKTVLAADFETGWPAISKKFKQDDKGLFYNEKLEAEMVKRKEYSASRKKNRSSKKKTYDDTYDSTYVKHMSPHMENGDINSSITVSITTTAREIFFNDLPNSQELETICLDLQLDKKAVIERIPEFRKSAETDYPTFQRFCWHFKNWLKRNPKSDNVKKLVR